MLLWAGSLDLVINRGSIIAVASYLIKEEYNPMKRLLLIAAAASISTASLATGGNDILWDNGNIDAVINGYSHLHPTRRSILDDFTVPEGPGWSVNDFHTYFVWADGSGDRQVDKFTLAIYRSLDNHPNGAGGEKGPDYTQEGFIHQMNIIGQDQAATGQVEFGRPVIRINAVFEKFTLRPGKYWIDMWLTAQNTNNFQLQSAHTQKNVVWAAYDDFPPVPQPGRNIFGQDADAIWSLTGKPVPEPMTMLALAGGFGLLIARRRRK